MEPSDPNFTPEAWGEEIVNQYCNPETIGEGGCDTIRAAVKRAIPILKAVQQSDTVAMVNIYSVLLALGMLSMHGNNEPLGFDPGIIQVEAEDTTEDILRKTLYKVDGLIILFHDAEESTYPLRRDGVMK